jgi:aldose 1-epimerase
MSFKIKDRDIVLGYDDIKSYIQTGEPLKSGGKQNFGTVVGRYANRIKNGVFQMDGSTYNLEKNNGDHHLHGGSEGFFNKVFSVPSYPTEKDGVVSITLTYVSPALAAGYPGTLTTSVTYSLHHGRDFMMEMCATTDAKTPVSLANHAYWNLAGHDSGPRGILDHTLHLNMGDAYTPVDEGASPCCAKVHHTTA